MPLSSNSTAASICEEISVSSSSAAFGPVMAERLASREMREVFSKFFADRGTHLAAMIAYFALLSFVPLLFLALALLGFAGRADESSFLVTELNKAFPSSSVDGILKVVRSIQDNAATLGVIGAVFVGWTSLSLFSVLESAFNIVYGKPNRSFLHGKLLAVMLLVGSLVTLFFGLLIGSVGYEILKRFAGFFFGNDYVAYAASILISTVSVFVFLFAVYYLLTNEKLTFREVLPGAIVSTIVLEASFQLLPIYLHLSKNVIALQAFGAPALLLVWLYLMANVIVFGAEVNWYVARGPAPGAGARRSRNRARLGGSVPALFAVGPRHSVSALEDEVVLAACPDADRVAVRVDRDRLARAPPREQQRSRRRVAAVHHLVRTGRPGGETDEITALQGLLPVGHAHDDRALDDE